MGGPDELTYKKKVLLYLMDYIETGNKETYPIDVTQMGIAEAVGMRRTHVSRAVKKLIEKGYVEENLGHVRGRTRKLKVYSLKPKGVEEAKDMLNELKDFEVTVTKDGDTFSCPITDLEQLTEGGLNILRSIELLEKYCEPLDLNELGPKEYLKELSGGPEVNVLYGRSEVLSAIDDWMKEDVPVAILKGRKGLGASSIARRFLDSVEDRHLLWVNVQKDDVQTKIREFFHSIHEDEKDMMEFWKETPALVVLDDYYEVEDELVDFLVELVDDLNQEYSTKLLITTREGLPVYERFYHREHLKKGRVVQIDVPPLTQKEAEQILGRKLESSAMRRIMLMTKGSPQILKLLKEDRVQEIEAKSALVKEQISLLMFLKEQKA